MNLLLITADQWRGDALSCAGHAAARTPNLDRLAGEGVVFLRHHGQATPCGPARASLHTGLYAFNHRSITNGTPLDRRHRTVAELARAAGYDPVLFGYTDTSIDPRTVPSDDPRLLTYEGIAPGYRAIAPLPEHMGAWLDHLAARGYGRRASVWEWYDGPLGAPAPWRAEDSETAFLTDRFLDWLARKAGDPWFAHLSLVKPHPPLVAAAPFHAAVPAEALLPPARAATAATEAGSHPWIAAHLEQPLGKGWDALRGRLPAELDGETLARLRTVYFGLIAEVDHQLGRVVDTLAASGRLDDTLILFTADHGEMLGDHYMLGKSGFFAPAFHVPLIARAPRGVRGRKVRRFTEHVDLMPTMLGALGLPVPLQGDGHSLMPFLIGDEPASWRTATHWEHDFRDLETRWFEDRLGLASSDCGIAVRLEERLAYIHFTALPPLCFDTRDDPAWHRNIAGDPGAAPALHGLAAGMLSWRMRHAERRLTEVKLAPGGPIGRWDPS